MDYSYTKQECRVLERKPYRIGLLFTYKTTSVYALSDAALPPLSDLKSESVRIAALNVLLLGVVWGTIKKSKMADTSWPPFESHDVFSTSCDVIISCCESQKQHH